MVIKNDPDYDHAYIALSPALRWKQAKIRETVNLDQRVRYLFQGREFH